MEEGTFNGLQGNVIVGDALWQDQCARAVSRTAQFDVVVFFPFFLAASFVMNWLIVRLCVVFFTRFASMFHSQCLVMSVNSK